MALESPASVLVASNFLNIGNKTLAKKPDLHILMQVTVFY